VILSSSGLDASPNVQSTLQHEIGHSFGLPHVDTYDYNMASSPSIMSYNPGHHTSGFRPSATPGRLIPEDLRGLGLNRRVFPVLRFDPQQDVPPGYRLAKLVWLDPMTIPGQPPYAPALKTPSGEDFGTAVGNIVGQRVEPSVEVRGASRAIQSFNSKTMWQSGPSDSGWVMIEASFPANVTLSGIGIHSQHSAKYHAADGVRVEAQGQRGYKLVAEQPLESIDSIAKFRPTRARVWHLYFHAADGHVVVLRGLRFFSQSGEITPPIVPYGQ
jgi:hypothetical protein